MARYRLNKGRRGLYTVRAQLVTGGLQFAQKSVTGVTKENLPDVVAALGTTMRNERIARGLIQDGAGKRREVQNG